MLRNLWQKYHIPSMKGLSSFTIKCILTEYNWYFISIGPNMKNLQNSAFDIGFQINMYT